MAESKRIRKEIEKRLKNVLDKVLNRLEKKQLPQLVLQPYRVKQPPFHRQK